MPGRPSSPLCRYRANCALTSASHRAAKAAPTALTLHRRSSGTAAQAGAKDTARHPQLGIVEQHRPTTRPRQQLEQLEAPTTTRTHCTACPNRTDRVDHALGLRAPVARRFPFLMQKSAPKSGARSMSGLSAARHPIDMSSGTTLSALMTASKRGTSRPRTGRK